MATYTVTVERVTTQAYQTTVDADDPDEARRLVEKMLADAGGAPEIVPELRRMPAWAQLDAVSIGRGVKVR